MADQKRLSGLPSCPGARHLHSKKGLSSRFGKSPRTIDRWQAQPDLKFPAAVIINRRRYWYDDEISEWERELPRLRNVRAAVADIMSSNYDEQKRDASAIACADTQCELTTASKNTKERRS